MRRVAIALLGLVACYSGHAQPGAPCMPSLENCPGGQTCELVAGNYICVEGDVPGADASTRDDAKLDSGTTGDGPMLDAAMTGPWTLVRTRAQMAAQLAIPATGAGHLLVVAVQTNSAAMATAVVDNVGNTYAPIAGSRAFYTNTDLGIELWYAQNSKAGATTITATAQTLYSVTVWEVAGIRTTNALDKVAQLSNQAATTAPAAPSITTAASGEFVVAIAIVGNAVNGLANNSAFTNDHLTFDNGWAHLTSNAAAAGVYQAVWTQPTADIYCATAAAFFAGP